VWQVMMRLNSRALPQATSCCRCSCCRCQPGALSSAGDCWSQDLPSLYN
jgi:hypothetical protein